MRSAVVSRLCRSWCSLFASGAIMYVPSQTSSKRSPPEAARSALSRSSSVESSTMRAMTTSAPLRGRQLQFLRPDRHDRERPRLVLLQISVNAVERDAVDRVLDFVQRADAAAHEEVVRDRAGA